MRTFTLVINASTLQTIMACYNPFRDYFELSAMYRAGKYKMALHTYLNILTLFGILYFLENILTLTCDRVVCFAFTVAMLHMFI